MKYTNEVVKLIQENKPNEIIFYEVYWGKGDVLIKGSNQYTLTKGIRLIEIIQASSNKILEKLLEYQRFVSSIQNGEEDYMDIDEYLENPLTFGGWYSDYIGDPIEVLFHEAVIEYKTIVTTDHSVINDIESKGPTFEELSKIESNVQEFRDDNLDHDDYGIIISGKNIDLPNMSMEIKSLSNKERSQIKTKK